MLRNPKELDLSLFRTLVITILVVMIMITTILY